MDMIRSKLYQPDNQCQIPKKVNMSDGVFLNPATPRTIDFAGVLRTVHWRDAQGRMHEEIEDDRPSSSLDDGHRSSLKGSPREGLVLSDKQMRARRRRQLKRGQRLSDAQFDQGMKPLEDWDMEELARGRPRNINGHFSGRPPAYINRELHERAMELFKGRIRSDMNNSTINAVAVIDTILTSDEVDDKGKPIVPAGTKLDAAKFLLEHIVGKPVQPTTSDISVKLQGILGAVMVNPTELGQQGQLTGYAAAHVGTRGGAIIMSPNDQGVYQEDEGEFDD